MAAGGFNFSVKANAAKMLRDFSRIQKQIIPKVTAKALNKAMDTVFTRSGKAIAGHHAITPRKALTGVRGRGGRLRKYPAKPAFLEAKVWLGTGKKLRVPTTRAKNLKRLVGEKSKPFKVPGNSRYGGEYVRHPIPSSLSFGGRKDPNFPFKRIDAATYGLKLGRYAERALIVIGRRYGNRAFRKEFDRLLKLRLNR